MANLAPRFRLPRVFERGVDAVPTLVVYSGAAPVAVTEAGSTYTVTDADGAEVFSGPVSVGMDNVVSAAVAGAFTADRDYSDRWIEEWALVIDGATHRFACDAINARRKLYNVVTQDDLKRRHPQIVAENLAPELADFSGQIEEAFEELERELIERGNRPNLIVSPWSCRACVLALALSFVFRDAITNANGESDRFRDLAKFYADEYAARFPKLTYAADANQDGKIGKVRPAASPVVFLSATPRATRQGLT